MRRTTVGLLTAALIASLGAIAAGPATAAAGLPFPVGTVFVGQEDPRQVVSIDIDGTVSTVGTGAGASGVAVDAVGDVYALTLDGALLEYPVDGSPAVSLATGLHGSGGVAVTNDGDVYVADQASGRVLKVQAGSRQVSTVGTGFVSPWGVAVDVLGNVFVSDSGAGAVFELPADAGPRTTVASGFTTPTGLAVSPTGDLFVADRGTGWVMKVNVHTGARDTFLGGLQQPYGVALDPFGNVYVSDAEFDAIAVGTAQHGSGYIAGPTKPRGVALFVPPPTFTTQPTPARGLIGTPYSTTAPTVVVPAGELAPTFSVVNGVLPQGLSLDPATGRISGTPSVPGTYPFQLQVANAATGTLSGPLSITVASPGFVAAYGPDRFGETRVPGSAGVNPSGVTSIAAAYGVSFAVANGRVVGWGDNGVGQLNVPAGAGSNVTSVAATSGGGLALKDDNTLVEWGFQAPALPAGLSGSTRPRISAITGENVFYLALAGGKVVEWGAVDNGFGISRLPAAVNSDVIAIDSGTGHGLALSQDGGVVGWGYNNAGQATVPDAARSFVEAIAAGGNHSLALKNDHTLVAWGDLNAVPAAAQGRTVAIAAGQSFDAALLYDGTIITWGATGTNQTIAPPADGTVTTALAAGDRHLLALRR